MSQATSGLDSLYYSQEILEKCMFCETMIEVPEPNTYAVICAACRQEAYETADRLLAAVEDKT